MSVTFNIHSNLYSAEETLSDAQVESILESNDTHIFAKDVCTCLLSPPLFPKTIYHCKNKRVSLTHLRLPELHSYNIRMQFMTIHDYGMYIEVFSLI